jgi:tRNA pseudouridine32 synthase/23S rRNA pseudouridine746 synthase
LRKSAVKLPLFIYTPPPEPLNILYQDDDLLVLSKPSGLLSVPGRAAEHADCLESRARAEFPGALLVHRLDLETSGVFIMALNKESQVKLGRQFENRETEKRYIARVWGMPEEDAGRVDLPLRCDWENRPRQMVCHEHGKPAQTDWEVLEREAEGFTRMMLKPVTGRSHQLRVHMEALGHPILGEVFYAHEEAEKAAERLQLHAQSLSVYHPVSGDKITFTDPAPF